MVVQWTGRPVMQRTTSLDTYNIRTNRIKKSCGGWLKGINFFSDMKKSPLKSFTLKISYHTILDCCMKKWDKPKKLRLHGAICEAAVFVDERKIEWQKNYACLVAFR